MPVNASDREEEYFARKEFEQLKTLEEQNRNEMAAAEKQALKTLHYMNCPKCGMTLIEVHYKDVAVDKCSGCDGIWLDAGEMELVSNLSQGVLSKWFDTFRK